MDPCGLAEATARGSAFCRPPPVPCLWAPAARSTDGPNQCLLGIAATTKPDCRTEYGATLYPGTMMRNDAILVSLVMNNQLWHLESGGRLHVHPNKEGNVSESELDHVF